MSGYLLPAWAAALGWSLLHFLWQGALLGALALLGLRLTRHGRPETRYLLGCLALAAMVLAFLGTFAWISREAQPLLIVTTPHPAGTTQGPGLVDRLRPWLPWVLAAWACGSAALGLRLTAGLVWLYGPCLRRARPAPRPWADRLEQLRLLMGCTRPVRLLLSDLVDSPLVVGFYRAVILVPASAFTALPPEALEAILAHELSHVRRWDFLVNFIQNLAEILLFFHPALWWVSRQVRREREHCCDDAAVLACGDRLRYAEALAALEALRPSPPTDIRMAPAGHGGVLVNRIRRILTACPPTLTLTRPGLLVLAAATALGAGTRMAVAVPSHPAPVPAPQAAPPPPAPPLAEAPRTVAVVRLPLADPGTAPALREVQEPLPQAAPPPVQPTPREPAPLPAPVAVEKDRTVLKIEQVFIPAFHPGTTFTLAMFVHQERVIQTVGREVVLEVPPGGRLQVEARHLPGGTNTFGVRDLDVPRALPRNVATGAVFENKGARTRIFRAEVYPVGRFNDGFQSTTASLDANCQVLLKRSWDPEKIQPLDPAAAPGPEEAERTPEVLPPGLKLRYRPDSPGYPPEAQEARLEGTVNVVLWVGLDGRPVLVRAEGGPPVLAAQAERYAQRHVYEPFALPRGLQRVRTRMTVVFRLQ